jgi:ABC-type sugar transport system substrate-binding protein
MTLLTVSGVERTYSFRTATCAILAACGLNLLSGCHYLEQSKEITAIPLFATENIASCEHVGLDEALANTSFRLHWNGPSDGDVQRLIDLLDGAVQRNDYGIIFEPRSLYAANSVVQEAATHSIPIVIMLHPVSLETGPHVSFVLEDVAEGARLAAQRVALLTRGEGEVLLVGLDSLTPGGEDRFDALERSLHATVPSVVIKGRIAGPPTISFFTPLIRQALEQQPEVRVIVALDSHAAYAAAAVVHDLGAQTRIGIVAFDQNTEVLASLRRGIVDSVIVQNMREMGHVAIRNILTDRSGGRPPEKTFVKPVLVTRDDIDADGVQHLLQMNLE